MNKYLLGVLTGVAATVVAVKYKDEIREYKDEFKDLCEQYKDDFKVLCNQYLEKHLTEEQEKPEL